MHCSPIIFFAPFQSLSERPVEKTTNFRNCEVIVIIHSAVRRNDTTWQSFLYSFHTFFCVFVIFYWWRPFQFANQNGRTVRGRVVNCPKWKLDCIASSSSLILIEELKRRWPECQTFFEGGGNDLPYPLPLIFPLPLPLRRPNIQVKMEAIRMINIKKMSKALSHSNGTVYSTATILGFPIFNLSFVVFIEGPTFL